MTMRLNLFSGNTFGIMALAGLILCGCMCKDVPIETRVAECTNSTLVHLNGKGWAMTASMNEVPGANSRRVSCEPPEVLCRLARPNITSELHLPRRRAAGEERG